MPEPALPAEDSLPPLSRVLGYIAVKELQHPDRVWVLARLGYGNAEIAKICGMTRAAVAELRSRVG